MNYSQTFMNANFAFHELQEIKVHETVHELFMNFHEMQILPFMNLPIHELQEIKLHEKVHESFMNFHETQILPFMNLSVHELLAI